MTLKILGDPATTATAISLLMRKPQAFETFDLKVVYANGSALSISA
jgi:hypothetical protein